MEKNDSSTYFERTQQLIECIFPFSVRSILIRMAFCLARNSCRRRKDDHIFLVAFYECDDYYELQPPDTDRLFCSGKQWIGQTPSCVSTRGEGEEDEEEEDEEEEEGKCGWSVGV